MTEYWPRTLVGCRIIITYIAWILILLTASNLFRNGVCRAVVLGKCSPGRTRNKVGYLRFLSVETWKYTPDLYALLLVEAIGVGQLPLAWR